MAGRKVADLPGARQIPGSRRSVVAMHPIERLRYVARLVGRAAGRSSSGRPRRALGGLGFDPAGLVTACRRVLDRHPTAGPLWWLAARVLTSVGDSDEEGWRCADELDDDTTVDELVHALPARGDRLRPRLARARRRGPRPPGRRRGPRHRRPRRRRRARSPAALRRSRRRRRPGHRPRRRRRLRRPAPPRGVGDRAGRPRGHRRLARGRGRRPPRRACRSGRWSASDAVCPAPLFDALRDRLAAEQRGEPWEGTDEVVPADLLDRVAGPIGLDRSRASPSPRPTVPSPRSCSAPCRGCDAAARGPTRVD